MDESRIATPMVKGSIPYPASEINLAVSFKGLGRCPHKAKMMVRVHLQLLEKLRSPGKAQVSR